MAQQLRTYSKSLQLSFKVKGLGRPRFKARKKSMPSFEYVGDAFSIREGRLVLPKCVSIPVVWHRELPSVPRAFVFIRTQLGDWYVSFIVRRPIKPSPEADGEIGIDWGVITTATTSREQFAGDRQLGATSRTRSGMVSGVPAGQTRPMVAKSNERASDVPGFDSAVLHHGLGCWGELWVTSSSESTQTNAYYSACLTTGRVGSGTSMSSASATASRSSPKSPAYTSSVIAAEAWPNMR